MSARSRDRYWCSLTYGRGEVTARCTRCDRVFRRERVPATRKATLGTVLCPKCTEADRKAEQQK